ncbi:MAG: hypothetical protein A2Y73_00215 [Chloroflexi bacterium RBG_13_56_8]|nr:MAG: hypothetical protein A2Y73_00215 [Chloroflexi bacterium RBG_13_56_8]
MILRRAEREDAEALIAAVDTVARERRYFLRSRFEQNVEVEREFLDLAVQRGNLSLVAEVEGDLVGWLFLVRQQVEFRRHVFEMGMGVLEPYRGIGVGTSLLKVALVWAAKAGVERVELDVRASNQRAHAFYRDLGFVEEGKRVRGVKDDCGEYDDLILMAYFP